VAHTHSHGAGHRHDHAPVNFGRSFAIGVGLNTVYVLIEAAFGYASHSMALVADAGHNFSDVLGLLLAWIAFVASKKAPTVRHTYGLRRSSILAALGNALILLIAVGGVAWESIGRFMSPEPVAGNTVMIVAGIGILVNGATAMMFMKGRDKDINIQGAYLHMASDALVSLGVVIAGVVIGKTGWFWLDPAASIVIVAVIAWSTWSLLRQSFAMAMDAVPDQVDPLAVKKYLEELPEVCGVHDLHIWGMSTTEIALTVHLVCPAGLDDERLHQIGSDLHDRFEVEHPTIQVERGTSGHPCPFSPDEVV